MGKIAGLIFMVSFMPALFIALGVGTMAALFALLRASDQRNSRKRAALVTFTANFLVVFYVIGHVLYHDRITTTFPGVVPLLIWTFFTSAVTTLAVDMFFGVHTFKKPKLTATHESANGGTIAMAILALISTVVYVFGINSGHDSKRASSIVPVKTMSADPKTFAWPASSLPEMGIVSPDMAETKASYAMNTGESLTKGWSTALEVGPAYVQLIDSQFVYAMPMEWNGVGGKEYVHGVSPGWFSYSATNTGAQIVPHFSDTNANNTMIVGVGMGQGRDPVRWLRAHGITGYKYGTPQFEVADSVAPWNGTPYYVVSLMTPHLGWTFYAPTKVALINAHTGEIQVYNIGDKSIPYWVDNIYTASQAYDIVEWYGKYVHSSFGVGTTSAGRWVVADPPTEVYLGAQHPVYRMILTSQNKDASGAYIVEFDSATGQMRLFTPAGSLSTENAVKAQVFSSPSGVGANNIRSNGSTGFAVDTLNLIVMYNHLTWEATYVRGKLVDASKPDSGYEPAAKPTVVAIAFVDAYNSQSNQVAVGSDLATAEQNYLLQLASVPSSQNIAAPGGAVKSIKGVISTVIHNGDTIGGQGYVYLQLVGDNHWYIGTSTSDGQEIVTAKPGNHVTMSVFQVTKTGRFLTLRSFDDVTQDALKLAS